MGGLGPSWVEKAVNWNRGRLPVSQEVSVGVPNAQKDNDKASTISDFDQ
jgi:hypothetical protein